jgi:chaperonin cofactor prefoldin
LRNSGDYTEIAALIQKSIEPLISKLDTKVDRLADKVDELARDRVTRADIEKMRSEIQSTFVLRAEYEPRHEALITRDSYLESEIKRIDSEKESGYQRLHERLESGKQQIEDRMRATDKAIDDVSKDFDVRLDKKNQAELSTKDRVWMHASQVAGIVALIIELLQHIHFQ